MLLHHSHHLDSLGLCLNMDVMGEDFPCVHAMSVRQRWLDRLVLRHLARPFFFLSSAPCRLPVLIKHPHSAGLLQLRATGFAADFEFRARSEQHYYPDSPEVPLSSLCMLALLPNLVFEAVTRFECVKRSECIISDSASHPRATKIKRGGPKKKKKKKKKIRAKLWNIFSDRSNDR